MPKPSCHGVGSLFEGHLLWVFLAGKIDLALAAWKFSCRKGKKHLLCTVVYYEDSILKKSKLIHSVQNKDSGL